VPSRASSSQARVGWGYRTAVEALESMSMVLTGPVWQPLMRLHAPGATRPAPVVSRTHVAFDD
jgi:hypothetical protein